MRSFVVAVVMFGVVSAAHAADLPDLPILRGGLTEGLGASRVNWDGYYVGAQGGYGSSDENFAGSTKNMTAALLANTQVESEMHVSSWDSGLGKHSARTSAWGAFAGYNSQWDDVVLGVEGSYMHGKFGGAATASPRPLSQVLTGGLNNAVSVTSTSEIAISDMATIRGRAGYALGAFLPYAFFGLALGNANISQSVQVNDYVSVPATNVGAYLPTLSVSSIQHNHLVYGYSAGLGVDVNLVGGLFARAEYEYVRFTSTVDTSINTARLGLGYKF
jgi:opacity protein-like surface antigen